MGGVQFDTTSIYQNTGSGFLPKAYEFPNNLFLQIYITRREEQALDQKAVSYPHNVHATITHLTYLGMRMIVVANKFHN